MNQFEMAVALAKAADLRQRFARRAVQELADVLATALLDGETMQFRFGMIYTAPDHRGVRRLCIRPTAAFARRLAETPLTDGAAAEVVGWEED